MSTTQQKMQVIHQKKKNNIIDQESLSNRPKKASLRQKENANYRP